MFEGDLDLLNYVALRQSPLNEIGCCFKRDNAGMGHSEFYKFGPYLLAVPVYHLTEKLEYVRIELLCVGVGMDEVQVDMAIKEMAIMIVRKRNIKLPRVRRIKSMG
jgi:hypothetical protein